MNNFKYTFLLMAILLTAPCLFAHTDHINSANNEGEIIILTKKDFLEKVYDYEKNRDRFVYEGNLPCIVDFYADWCGPCRMVDPILKDLAKEYKGKIIIYKVNIDNEKSLAKAFGIMSIPTYFFIPVNGEPQASQGAMPRESFLKVIKEILLND